MNDAPCAHRIPKQKEPATRTPKRKTPARAGVFQFLRSARDRARVCAYAARPMTISLGMPSWVIPMATTRK
jgi:hypothetical protein